MACTAALLGPLWLQGAQGALPRRGLSGRPHQGHRCLREELRH